MNPVGFKFAIALTCGYFFAVDRGVDSVARRVSLRQRPPASESSLPPKGPTGRPLFGRREPSRITQGGRGRTAQSFGRPSRNGETWRARTPASTCRVAPHVERSPFFYLLLQSLFYVREWLRKQLAERRRRVEDLSAEVDLAAKVLCRESIAQFNVGDPAKDIPKIMSLKN